MNDAFSVSGAERIANLHGVAQGLLEREWTAELSPLDKFHDQVAGADIVDLADVTMIQGGDGASLVVEAVCETRTSELYRDIAAHPGVVRLVHLTHATRADRPQDFIGADASPARKRHVWILPRVC